MPNCRTDEAKLLPGFAAMRCVSVCRSAGVRAKDSAHGNLRTDSPGFGLERHRMGLHGSRGRHRSALFVKYQWRSSL